MKLVCFQTANAGQRVGVLVNGRVVMSDSLPDDLGELISGWDHFELERLVDTIDSHPWAYSLGEIDLLPPIPRNGTIICVGMNYPAPGTPVGEKPEFPVLFLKGQHTVNPPGAAVILPSISQQVFCEGELVAVIGREGKHIAPENALDHVFGYTIANDIGARDLENRTSQWATGKLPETFLPVGPVLVTHSGIPDINNLTIKVSINDMPYLEGNTGDMIFGLPELIAYISSIKTLKPGDLIVTGSPKGLGEQPAPVQFLKPGDMVSVTIEPIGTLTNPVLAEEPHHE